MLCKDSFGFGFALFGTLWPMLEIFRKLYLFTGSCRLLRRLFDYARGSTQKGKEKKKKKKKTLKIRAEFMTSVSYRPEVISTLFQTTYCIVTAFERRMVKTQLFYTYTWEMKKSS